MHEKVYIPSSPCEHLPVLSVADHFPRGAGLEYGITRNFCFDAPMVVAYSPPPCCISNGPRPSSSSDRSWAVLLRRTPQVNRLVSGPAAVWRVRSQATPTTPLELFVPIR